MAWGKQRRATQRFDDQCDRFVDAYWHLVIFQSQMLLAPDGSLNRPCDEYLATRPDGGGVLCLA
jgi:hypothetical protein